MVLPNLWCCLITRFSTDLKQLLLKILPSCFPLGSAQVPYSAPSQELIELGFHLGLIDFGLWVWLWVWLWPPWSVDAPQAMPRPAGTVPSQVVLLRD